MTERKLNIVFMGTPDFASTCLEAILESNHNVVGVVTAPDRQSGRGRKINQSSVKKLALSKGLNIAQPEKLKSPEFQQTLNEWNADIFIVVAFRMLPEVVWDMPPMGTFNLHASLLPQFRGAAPIQRAIMQGATKSGATVFKLTHEIDTGNILSNVELEIGQNENAGSLHDRILTSGAQLLVDTINTIAEGKDTYTPQSELITGELLEAPKIFKEDKRIIWDQPCFNVHNHIRGLSPYPSAFTTLNSNEQSPIKIIEGAISNKSHLNPGEVEITKYTILVGTQTNCYQIHRLQPAGKSSMEAKSFIIGLRDSIEKFD